MMPRSFNERIVIRVFVTGSTGFIGSVVVKELIANGHQVVGLTRSDSGAQWLAGAGATAHRGSLEDLDSLRRGAEASEGVLHIAFDHDFANFAANCEKDRRVIEALGDGLAGSARPLVITSGIGMGTAAHGQVATEDVFNADHPNPRVASELAGLAVANRGGNVSVVRLPQVHDTRKQGLITPLIDVARQTGVSAYVGDGSQRWSAVALADATPVYRLAIERGEASARYHAVAEEGVSLKAIAETIGRGLNVPVVSQTPEEARAHFGWLGMFVGLDMAASSAITRATLGWQPTGPGLLADLERMDYAAG